MKPLTLSVLLLLTALIAASQAEPAKSIRKPGEPAVEPLPLKAVRAFPNLRLERPIVLTHPGDGTDRLIVVSQLGKVFVMPNDQEVEEPALFLDISDRVVFKKQENEEGLLGLAFHPQYKKNGQFFIYYTTTDAPHTSVISRFRVSKDDPNKADADFEEELLRIKQPFWNHNGGGLAFGPDGMLYIALGDGGKANDPLENGQNLGTLLGSILRIDVDHHDRGLAYAIPKDNPFVGKQGARGEIWAYGLRNVWGMSFDRKTGVLWAGDVGQNLWEEVDIIVRGGNYGWNIREGFHNFVPKDAPAAKDPGKPEGMIDPIFEYHHDVGKSITGGYVYRGERLPELQGKYLCADYVSNGLWALQYDHEKQQLVSVNSIPENMNHPIIAFGEDRDGELYFTTEFGMIYRFERE
ncbi:MAG: PQQ-dependent sugar dehydrogenase [Pirellulaceae bacterium]